MSEETQEETKKEESEATTEDTPAGDNAKASGLIDGANAAAERLEKGLAELKKENDRSEEIIAKKMLGGSEDAKPEEKKEESPAEYRDRVMKTGHA
jgi:hypothetical protein